MASFHRVVRLAFVGAWMVSVCVPALAQQAVGQHGERKLEDLIAGIGKYDYGLGREDLLAFSAYLTEHAGDTQELARAEKQLLGLLGSSASLAAKEFACRELGLIGTQVSVPVLWRLLLFPSTADSARYGLERIPGPTVDKVFRSALLSTSGRARIGIINTLGERRDHEAVPILVSFLASDETVESAAASLGRIGDAAAVNALLERKTRADGPLRVRIEEALMNIADQLAAAGNLKQAVPIYKEMVFRNEPVPIRIGGYTGLAKILGPAAIPLLLTSVKEEEPDVQAVAMNLLLDSGVAGVGDQLLRIMPELSSPAKARLLVALGDHDQRSAASQVIGMAEKEPDAQVREAAVRALAMLGDGSCVPLLARIARETTGGLQEAARSSLYRMRGQDVDQAVVSSIQGAEAGTRMELLRAIGERNIGTAANPAAQLLTDQNPGVRREAVRALQGVGGESEVAPLVRLLQMTEQNPERTEGERALSSILRRTGARGLSSVTRAYEQSNRPQVRQSFLTVFGAVGAPEGLPILRKALHDQEPDVRRSAIVALGEWPDASPLPDLLSAASQTQDSGHHVLALRSYLKLVALPAERPMADSVRLLSAALETSRDSDIKKAVLAALPRFACPEALGLATAALQNPDLKAEAEQAINSIKETLSARQ